MITYTKDDIKVLADVSSDTLRVYLKHKGYTPEALDYLLKGFPKERAIVFGTPYEELPLRITDPSISGYLRWRFKIGH